MSAQVWAGSGAPVATLAQIPIDPEIAQDLHALAQAVAQQTPWAQLTDVHSDLSEQKAPFGFFPQELSVQTLPALQLALTVHALKQRVPLQAKGTQARLSGEAQRPVASQVDSGVKTLLAQRSGAQTVPGAYFRQAAAPSH
jgi:hypothetical protein